MVSIGASIQRHLSAFQIRTSGHFKTRSFGEAHHVSGISHLRQEFQ